MHLISYFGFGINVVSAYKDMEMFAIKLSRAQ